MLFDFLGDLFVQMIGGFIGDSALQKLTKALNSRTVDVRRDKITRRSDLPGYIEPSPVSGEPPTASRHRLVEGLSRRSDSNR
jgi:hypothetical protein